MKAIELKRLLNGIPDDTELYIKDHDQSEYETNGRVTHALYLNQHNAPKEIEKCFKIEGDYFVISG